MAKQSRDTTCRPVQPDEEYNEALCQAQDQVEAMTGNWETPVRFRLIDQRYDVPKEQRRPAVQRYGSLSDEEFCRELWKLNDDDRYDVYVVAQEVSGKLSRGASVNARDIESGRVIVADFDDKPFVAPSESWAWHLPPSFVLQRENSRRHYWVGWQTEWYSSAQIRDIHMRVIQRYRSDPAVCDPARIIRLAGFYSHKRKEQRSKNDSADRAS